MTATCTCPPGDCHGGHTINVDPASIDNRPTDDQLRTWLDPYGDSFPAYYNDEHDEYLDAMFAELLALRARVAEAEEARDIAEGQWRLSCDEANEARARVAELEAEAQADQRAIEEARDERDAARDRAAEAETEQQELIGFAVVSTAGQDDYLCLASDLLHRQADTAHGELIMARAESPSTPWRVVELREATE